MGLLASVLVGCAQASVPATRGPNELSLRLEQLDRRVRDLESAAQEAELTAKRVGASQARLVDLRPWQAGAEREPPGRD